MEQLITLLITAWLYVPLSHRFFTSPSKIKSTKLLYFPPKPVFCILALVLVHDMKFSIVTDLPVSFVFFLIG